MSSAPSPAVSSRPFRIFVVEDDVWYGELLMHHLMMNPDYQVHRFTDARSLFARLHEQPEVITLDYSLPDIKGDEALRRIRKDSPLTSVVVISAQENINTAISLLRTGAYDYIVKDEEARERLWNTINNIRQQVALRREVDELREQIGKKYDLNNLITGACAEMQKVFQLIDKAAKTQITVSISGETGTGKELVAKAIHFNSARAKTPFVAVNVAAIPRDLIESELFGHEKGAFTGAFARRVGKFEEANQGTLFLDEIAELDLNLQSKLLRVLQEKEITRLGSNTVIPIDTRIVVATHHNLAEAVRKGAFREDLYYRLLGLPIELPPLRNRGNDILLLAKHFLDLFCSENSMSRKSLTEDARAKLLVYRYPGNVRELKATIELAAVLSDSDKVTATDITFSGVSNANQLLELDLSMEEYTNRLIRITLDKCGGNVIAAAERLQIGKSTIYRLLKENKI